MRVYSRDNHRRCTETLAQPAASRACVCTQRGPHRAMGYRAMIHFNTVVGWLLCNARKDLSNWSMHACRRIDGGPTHLETKEASNRGCSAKHVYVAGHVPISRAVRCHDGAHRRSPAATPNTAAPAFVASGEDRGYPRGQGPSGSLLLSSHARHSLRARHDLPEEFSPSEWLLTPREWQMRRRIVAPRDRTPGAHTRHRQT